MGGLTWPSVLMCVVMVLSSGMCQDNCVKDGKPGESGIPGIDGRQGPRGDKGDPAPVSPFDPDLLVKLKGERGLPGLAGEMGSKGYSGDLGPEGVQGPIGPPGPADDLGHVSDQSHSAFSVVRTLNSYPTYNQRVTFQTALINQPPNFDLETGVFTAPAAGVYYFVFHAETQVSMCLKLRSSGENEPNLGFCDYNSRSSSQVLSGGAVRKLTERQTVWLESFHDHQDEVVKRNMEAKKIVFNGFLLFPT